MNTNIGCVPAELSEAKSLCILDSRDSSLLHVTDKCVSLLLGMQGLFALHVCRGEQCEGKWSVSSVVNINKLDYGQQLLGRRRVLKCPHGHHGVEGYRAEGS